MHPEFESAVPFTYILILWDFKNCHNSLAELIMRCQALFPPCGAKLVTLLTSKGNKGMPKQKERLSVIDLVPGRGKGCG